MIWKEMRTTIRLAGEAIHGEQPSTRPVRKVSETRRNVRGRAAARPWKKKLRKTRAHLSVGGLCWTPLLASLNCM